MISNRARFDFQIPVSEKRVLLNKELPKGNLGEVIIDKTCTVFIEDSDTVIIKASGKPLFSAFIICPFFDAGYAIKCDVPAMIGSKGRDIGERMEVSQTLFLRDYAMCSITNLGSVVYMCVYNDDSWNIQNN